MDKKQSFEQAFENCLQSMHKDNETGVVQGIFRFAQDFVGFEGHFPGNPILPAVVQLAAVRWLFKKSYTTDIQLKKVERAKFKQMIEPGEQVKIQIQPEENNREYRLSFSIKTGKGLVASGTLSCFEAGERA